MLFKYRLSAGDIFCRSGAKAKNVAEPGGAKNRSACTFLNAVNCLLKITPEPRMVKALKVQHQE
jgi:hypothetical protein